MATTDNGLVARRAAWRAAWLITSDDAAEIRQGARLMLSLPRNLRAEIMTAIDYYVQEEEGE